MKTLYLDLSMGAAGDMLSAALFELLTDEEKAVFLRKMNSLGLPGVTVSAEPAVKCGITGTHMKVLVNGEEEGAHEHHHEHHHDHEHEHEHEHEHHHEHEHEHEHHHHHHYDENGVCSCGHHHHHHHGHDADEVFTSWGRETAHKYSREELEEILKKLSVEEDNEFGIILRAKGIIPDKDNNWLEFDLVPGEYEIREGSADYTGKLCVIGSQLKEDKVAELFGL